MNISYRSTIIKVVCLLMTGLSNAESLAQTTTFNGVQVPGIVIDHLPRSTSTFIGSPSLVIAPNGDYIATRDEFGPNADNVTNVFRSTDQGLTWAQTSSIDDQYWSNLFVYQDDLYLMGTSSGSSPRDLTIRKSVDGGGTWTVPTGATDGLLAPSPVGQIGYHTAPMPVVEHDGRVWRAFELTETGGNTPIRPFMMSAPLGSDLLDASNWTLSNQLSHDPAWLPGAGFNYWLEGNAVVDRNGDLVNILRVDVDLGDPEKAAIVRVQDPSTISFDPVNDIIDMPGGAKKFSIRYDNISDSYWTLANVVDDENYDPALKPAEIRNHVALLQSTDLVNWETKRTILKDLTNVDKVGFQYLDWQFDGQDIVAVSRTAYNDGVGGANTSHNANFLTFHRIDDFRNEPVITPVTYWRFEEGAGQTTANEEAGALNLSLQRGASQSTYADPEWSANGFVGGALAYSAGDIVTLTTGESGSPDGLANASELLSNEFTVEAFINLNGLPAQGFSTETPYNVIELRDMSGLEQNYQLRVSNDGNTTSLEVLYKTVNGNLFIARHDTDLLSDQWYYIAVTRDAFDTVKLYVGDAESDLGGELDVLTIHGSADPSIASITDPQLSIGAELKSIGFHRSFNGLIDEVRLSTAALSVEDLLFYDLAGSMLAGDLDGDGYVGIADLNIVLGNWNSAIPPGNPAADPSGDGFVGIEDLNVVLGNWNTGVPPADPIQNIPEPAIFGLLLMWGVAALRYRT